MAVSYTHLSDQKMTSDFMAASIGTNPVIVRKILQQLKAAGLIAVSYTHLDVYKRQQRCAR